MMKLAGWQLAAGCVVVGVGISAAEAMFMPGGVDWRESFRPAAMSMLAGRSPYEVESFFNPFWTLILLAPLCALPVTWGFGVLYTANLFGYMAVLWREKVPPVWAAVFVLLSGMLLNSKNANIEGLVALGLIMPRPIGMLFVLMKPQLGAGVALIWTWEAWREGGWRKVMRLLWPTLVLSAASVGLYGLWFLQAQNLDGVWWNRSIFPYGLPLGAYCLWLAVRDRQTGWAVAAGPLLSPYLAPHSWAFLGLGVLMGTRKCAQHSEKDLDVKGAGHVFR